MYASVNINEIFQYQNIKWRVIFSCPGSEKKLNGGKTDQGKL
jgi:hypothetical protein